MTVCFFLGKGDLIEHHRGQRLHRRFPWGGVLKGQVLSLNPALKIDLLGIYG